MDFVDEINRAHRELADGECKVLTLRRHYDAEVNGNNPGFPEVEVRLSAAAGGTLFELMHAAEVPDFWSGFGPGAAGVGWDLALLGLGLHLSLSGSPDQVAATTTFHTHQEEQS
ncbi:hypothetical protein E1292_15690 [Nonomuraea deserti]|uniref:Uncharacterized protein n=1 Tax=Nonomuraea deserti TaxID=1848322 RepID=A0A4R4VZV3_9ACTN|nr:hypothetical protein [Nonomuraea deserti]TDD06120.1 hypothetical protein E1292_15690 [Nonomuraea deserti]